MIDWMLVPSSSGRALYRAQQRSHSKPSTKSLPHRLGGARAFAPFLAELFPGEASVAEIVMRVPEASAADTIVEPRASISIEPIASEAIERPCLPPPRPRPNTPLRLTLVLSAIACLVLVTYRLIAAQRVPRQVRRGSHVANVSVGECCASDHSRCACRHPVDGAARNQNQTERHAVVSHAQSTHPTARVAPPRVAAPIVARGCIRVIALPWGDVWIDHQTIGRAPVSGFKSFQASDNTVSDVVGATSVSEVVTVASGRRSRRADWHGLKRCDGVLLQRLGRSVSDERVGHRGILRRNPRRRARDVLESDLVESSVIEVSVRRGAPVFESPPR